MRRPEGAARVAPSSRHALAEALARVLACTLQVLAVLALGWVWGGWAPAARAEFDYPVTLRVPSWDVGVGLSGGVAFGEGATRLTSGALGGVDAYLLHGVFGLHVGVRAHPEGESTRIEGLGEVSWWYILMLGVGVTVGHTTSPPGPGVAASSLGFRALVALPLPLWRFDEGRDGALVLMPFVRPGLRFVGRGEVVGYHEAGLSLAWTSFGF